jgi:hypothetical protein
MNTRRYFLQTTVLSLIGGAILTNYGCGVVAPTNTGRVAFSVPWRTTRAILDTANSIRFDLTDAKGKPFPQTLDRPNTSVSFVNIPVGTAHIKATAYADSDASGSVLGSGETDVQVVAGQTVSGSITLKSATGDVIVDVVEEGDGSNEGSTTTGGGNDGGGTNMGGGNTNGGGTDGGGGNTGTGGGGGGNEVTPVATEVTARIEPAKSRYARGENITLVFTLKSAGMPLAGFAGDATQLWDGGTRALGAQLTDGTGEWRKPYQVPRDKDNVRFSFRFNGNDAYNPSGKEIRIPIGL